MRGNLYFIHDYNQFGFINGEDKNEYFFHKSDLLNAQIYDLYEGDLLEFDGSMTDKGYVAKNIRKIGGVQIGFDGVVKPGINPLIEDHFDHFSKQEVYIINRLSKVFYVTNAGRSFQIGQSTYKFFYVKPTQEFTEQFNLRREIVVIFSDYATFEPRSLDGAAQIITKNQKSALRLEKICNILISSDPNIENKITSLLKNDLDMQVIIPFSYQELSNESCNKDLVVNRFRKYFFDRDLFDQATPIQKDIHFFGRRDYVQNIVNRAVCGEHSGVFGLRRSGKTSVLFAIIRALNNQGVKTLFIDCQDAKFYLWNEFLYEILVKIYKTFGKELVIDKKEFTPKEATAKFHELLLDVLNGERIVVLFDEIEHITFDIALNDNWKNGTDFIYFWQAIRAFYQTHTNLLSIIVAGTNPKINETPIICDYDNPMFQQLTNDTYLPAFDLDQTKDLVKRLGGYMGLIFNDSVCVKLTEDLGGHPFLIRKVCSRINKFVNQNSMSKPCLIDSAIYNVSKKDFDRSEASGFCDLILSVLQKNYKNEYEALKNFALNNQADNINDTIISHLLGYNIIFENNGIYEFKINVVKEYLQKSYKYEKLNLSQEEKRTEISIRRNRCEEKLRSLIKTQLLSKYNKIKAKEILINCLASGDQPKAKQLNYDDLFDSKKTKIYFSSIIRIIESEWNCFLNIFSCKKDYVISQLTSINDLRVDCHAKDISEEDFGIFRSAITWLDKII